MPCSRRYASPCPETAGFGSCTATTTRAMPDATIGRTHGPVRPVWQQGSSVTYMVAPRARSPATRRAWISACGSPARSWAPCPTRVPSGATITHPTIGLGLTVARPRSARHSATRMCVGVGLGARIYHDVSKSASTYSRGENGTMSSMVSPVPT